jgi:hypothetical protein
MDSIPADWEGPIATPEFFYRRGLDHLAVQWERTKPLASSEPGTEGLHEYLFWRKNLVIWASCAVEAFVNAEGVDLLGEPFYGQNLEMSRICQKIAVLYALKYGRRLPESNAVLKAVRALFEFRNRLVHPKTRVVRAAGGAKDDMRTKLDEVSPKALRRVIGQVTDLFEPDGQTPGKPGQ